LLPWLIIKDSVYYLKRCFVKKSSNLKTSQNLIAKHSSAILKAALVGSACLGLIKLRELTGVEVNNQSFLDKLVWPGSVMAALGVGAFISTQHSKEPVNEPELDDPFRGISTEKELESKFINIKEKRKIEDQGLEIRILNVKYNKKKFELIKNRLNFSQVRDLSQLINMRKDLDKLEEVAKSVESEAIPRFNSLSIRLKWELHFTKVDYAEKKEKLKKKH